MSLSNKALFVYHKLPLVSSFDNGGLKTTKKILARKIIFIIKKLKIL